LFSCCNLLNFSFKSTSMTAAPFLLIFRMSLR
jgi:hypothetical protein